MRSLILRIYCGTKKVAAPHWHAQTRPKIRKNRVFLNFFKNASLNFFIFCMITEAYVLYDLTHRLRHRKILGAPWARPKLPKSQKNRFFVVFSKKLPLVYVIFCIMIDVYVLFDFAHLLWHQKSSRAIS